MKTHLPVGRQSNFKKVPFLKSNETRIHSGTMQPSIRVEMLVVFMSFIMFSNGNLISLEDRLTKLETKNSRLEEKVTELEARNAQLESKVEEQDKILNSLLLDQTNQSDSGTKVILTGQTALQSSGKSGTPRTCRELRAIDPSLPSGMHWIDPDGSGVGDDPIYVYCNMISGATSVLHDSELPIDVGHCADPGCYSRSINYNASINQIKSLIGLSAECHQSIKYDCYYAPLEFNTIPYAWWNDRDGNAQYFWAGNNTGGIHTCQCGINGNCVDNSLKCNCDVAAPVQLSDDGVITDNNVLPVTRLNFGRTLLETSSGIHTLGRFECTGTVALTGLPTSCEDLWLIGHTLNGVYSVKGATMMESVYCDFTKLPDDADFQKWIGYVDIKSAPVYFYVQRNSSFTTSGTPIPWDAAVVNEGNAMVLTTGKFTAPRPGIYFFSFTGLADFPTSTSTVVLINVGLYLNGGRIAGGAVEESNTVNTQSSPLTVQSTMKLKKGDQVWVAISSTSTGAYLFDNVGHYTHFTGFMLDEEIAASL